MTLPSENPSLPPKAATQHILHLAARLFAAEIDQRLLASLSQTEHSQAHATSDESIVFMDPALLALDQDCALRELSTEFCRLFVGPNPCCPPYASVHRHGVLLGGRSGRHFESLMTRHGFELAKTSSFVSADHIAVQLSILALLDEHETSGELANGACRELLVEHLLPWAPAYLGSVASSARWAPYRTLPRLAAAILENWES